MSTANHKIKISFSGCDAPVDYRGTVDKLVAMMESNKAPYSASATLIVRKRDGEVTTRAKDAINLNADEKALLNSLEEMALDASKKGGEPNKVKTEVLVEKDI